MTMAIQQQHTRKVCFFLSKKNNNGPITAICDMYPNISVMETRCFLFCIVLVNIYADSMGKCNKHTCTVFNSMGAKVRRIIEIIIYRRYIVCSCMWFTTKHDHHYKCRTWFAVITNVACSLEPNLVHKINLTRLAANVNSMLYLSYSL